MNEHVWQNIIEDSEVDKLRLEVLAKVFHPKTQRQVEAGMEFSRFVKLDKVNPDNYPLFLEFLRSGNHAIVQAMVGGEDPNLFFLGVESNPYMIRSLFEVMYDFAPGQLDPLVFGVALGVLLKTYANPKVGLLKYKLSMEELNAIAKNLNEDAGQEDPLNRQILDFLGDIGDMVIEGLWEKDEYGEIATHAIDLRNAFLDPRQNLADKIPELLVRKQQYVDDNLRPRKTQKPTGGGSE
ncbi:MAG: hypothetical protein D6B26_01580 [Spirochaetaceae bacterium]|nr:MAG: hypothetical protein D6B26_01580 [Spirochaetaceae bacterium]